MKIFLVPPFKSGLMVAFLVCLFFLPPHKIQAQIRGVTESGEEVLLFQDGTWKFVNDSASSVEEIKMNAQKFFRDKSAGFLVKSSKVDVAVWMNPKLWSFSKAESDEASELKFERKDLDLYGMLITERIQIPLDNLKDIALDNARKVAPDIRIKKQEYRNVNGLKVLMLQMSGTIQGIKFTYFGYYFSFLGGTVQFLTYTSSNLFDTYEKDAEQLLNGLVKQ